MEPLFQTPPLKNGYSYCWSHKRYEPNAKELYIQCPECGHVYETSQDLVNAWINKQRDNGFTGEPPNHLEIKYCQECWKRLVD